MGAAHALLENTHFHRAALHVSIAIHFIAVGKDKKTFMFLANSYVIIKAGMLTDAGFLKSLFYFSQHEKDNMNDETLELLAPYLELDSFVPSVARNASRASEGLCAWVRAMAM